MEYSTKVGHGHKWVSLFWVLLLVVLVGAITQWRPQPAKAVAACSVGASAQNGITVAPSHGQAFYIDTGTTPKLDAGYIGYRVTNGTGTTATNTKKPACSATTR